MTSRTVVFIFKEGLLWKFLCMNADENSQRSQIAYEIKYLPGCSEPPSSCHLSLFGLAWSLKAGLVCFGDSTFSFSHIISAVLLA